MSLGGLPDRIGPDMSRKETFGDRARKIGRSVTKKLTTRQGLLGAYDYAFLFRPNLPFMKKPLRGAPFFGLDDTMPVFLALLLGFQHALAMLAGIITPPLIMSGQGGVNLSEGEQQYLVSTSLIVCGILSSVQITRFHIRGTP
jgi:uric acid-xanthine permease